MTKSSKDDENSKEFLRALGRRIATLREMKKLSQRELAEACSVNIKTISRVELGSISPNIQTIIAVAQTLEVAIDYLIYGRNRINHPDPLFVEGQYVLTTSPNERFEAEIQEARDELLDRFSATYSQKMQEIAKRHDRDSGN